MNNQSEQDLKNLSPSFFADAGELRQICFSRSQLTFHFEHMKIDVQNTCEIRLPGSEVHIWTAFEASTVNEFGNLLGSSIAEFSVPGPRLLLTFSNACTLLLTDDDSGYECFIISKEGGYGDVIV